jgi:Asp-tRNA(Asn)/Glu-tRNA(Gln) amidotransferase A subunit family amidase
MTETVEVCEATIAALQDAMAAGQASSTALMDAYLARIEAYDRNGPRLNAMIRLNPAARAAAAARDGERRAGRLRGTLHGVPVILKDNYATAEMPTAAASRALAALWPREDAFQVRRLREAGAVILGKANMDELAEMTTGLSSLGGQTRNPYAPDRIPGGSSGGSAVAAAASFAAIAFGTDTGSSIRVPAADNNLFALRPTKGLSSIAGIIPYSLSHDTAGPMARSVTDLAIALDATIGRDSLDPATAILDGHPLPRFVDALDANALSGARLGLLRSYFGGPDDAEVAQIVMSAIERIAALGATTMEVALPDDIDPAKATVWDFEFAEDLAEFLAGVPDAPVRSLAEILDNGNVHPSLESRLRQVLAGPGRDSAEHRAGLAEQARIRRAVVGPLDAHKLDALVYPTVRRKPALIGEPPRPANTRLSAVTGLPALTAPAGFTADGLPVGMELLGRPLADARLVALAFAYEQAVQPRRLPPTTTPL